MPRIQWTNLPPALRDHLFDRLRDRKITVEDLYQLKLWSDSGHLLGPDLCSFGACNRLRNGHLRWLT